VNDFFKENRAEVLRVGEGNTEHLIIRNFPIQSIVKLISSINFNGTHWESSYYIKFLQTLQRLGIADSLDVIFMSKGNPRGRSMDENGRIQPMQGRSDTYPGDTNFHNDRLQLQIHNIVCLNNSSVKTVAFALYVPKNEIYHLPFYVRDG
jgi:hypothetical protein